MPDPGAQTLRELAGAVRGELRKLEQSLTALEDLGDSPEVANPLQHADRRAKRLAGAAEELASAVRRAARSK